MRKLIVHMEVKLDDGETPARLSQKIRDALETTIGKRVISIQTRVFDYSPGDYTPV